MSLAKYRHAFLIGLQSNLVYRWNFAVRASFSFIHLAYVFILWGAAFQGRTQVGGFDLGQTLTYFVVVLILQFFISAMHEDYEISEEIRNGLINQFLLKPINYFAYRFSIFTAARIVSGGLALIPILIVLPFLSGYLALPEWGWTYVMALPALILSALIQFTLAYCFGLLTFWFLEIQSFVILSLAIESVLGGQVFPLDLFPRWLYEISTWLPYYYQMYFPAAILTGRIADPSLVLRGLGIQIFWALALYGIAQLLWMRGLRRHTAVGG
ncbi:MAG: ABC-2 family transporter protein [Opitutaceae bacterium]|nr:ABC-2 family transporter protein [Opitutaceae bacterium]